MVPVNASAAIGTKRLILFIYLDPTTFEAGTRGLVVDVRSATTWNIQFPSARGWRAGRARDWCFIFTVRVENRRVFIIGVGVGIDKRMDFLLRR